MKAPARQIRCAIYTRKSTEEGLEQDYNSLHAQRDACAAYILSQAGEGWTLLPEVYDDGGFSGGNMERPALKRLMAEIEAGRIDVVVVYKVDRLTRALTDFSRIVDVLDKTGASFVSVTQAFNTTTSMGRLTLNVLLSFAQFEREVTGERIRDKIAASKKLGMWMGGGVPLGYDPDGRTLAINPAEAETVRGIYCRYLELGSAHLLCRELADQGVLSKRTISKAGVVRGGVPIERGALFHILRNRIYIGEIPHNGAHYPGQHPAIVDRDLFDAVQAKLGEKQRRPRAKGQPRRPHTGVPLTGLIYDSAGNRMSPVSCSRKNGATYRYYVSAAIQSGAPDKAGACPRVSAPIVEQGVADHLQNLGLCRPIDLAPDWPRVRDLVDRVEVGADALTVVLDAERLDLATRDLQGRERLVLEQLERREDGSVITIPMRIQRRGGSKIAVGPQGQSPLHKAAVDPALSSALIRAESWKRKLLAGDADSLESIAKAEGVKAAYAARLIRTAFLAPDLKQAILDGDQPEGLTLQRVMTQDVPLDWDAQRQLYRA